MKITKFAHSCVLVESGSGNILFDPGIFSWQSGTVSVDSLPNLDAITVSHGHPDHCAEPFVRSLVARFPNAQWFAPSDTCAQLKEWGVLHVVSNSLDNFQVKEVDHAKVQPFGTQVKNLIVNWDGLVTHPGDTHEITATHKVLLLPVQAPWGTTIRAIELALELQPEYVLPIHDWMWNDTWREDAYGRLETIFAGSPTTFLRPVDGVPITIDL